MIVLQNPFLFDETTPRFTLDEARFMADIEGSPAFLGNPSPEYLSAVEIMPVLEVLAGHALHSVIGESRAR